MGGELDDLGMERWVDSLPKGEHLGIVSYLGMMHVSAPVQVPVIELLGAHVEIVHPSH